MVFVVVASVLLPALAAAQVYVSPYMRRDGTEVQGHYRSAPDSNPYNNYSYPGNTNPYTGRVAPGNPDTYLRDNYRGPAVQPYGGVQWTTRSVARWASAFHRSNANTADGSA
jgi:hypothetical protein